MTSGMILAILSVTNLILVLSLCWHWYETYRPNPNKGKSAIDNNATPLMQVNGVPPLPLYPEGEQSVFGKVKSHHSTMKGPSARPLG